jgi:SAM-dependent methyltransferase
VLGSRKLQKPGKRPAASSSVRQACAGVLKQVLPVSVLRLVARFRNQPYSPPKGRIQFGDFRRQTPFSRDFGYDRGLPIDRYYIEKFLAKHAGDISGRVLEIGANTYTRKFGADRVTRSDVLHVNSTHPAATITGDLISADHIQSDCFDCIILTQTLQLIYDVPAALATVGRILKPGGVCLASFPGITQIPRGYWDKSWCWGFTTVSATRLFEKTFPAYGISVEALGNVLASVAFLAGVAAEELEPRELDFSDSDYQMLITVRAVKAAATTGYL